jgi:hypothetical protein
MATSFISCTPPSTPPQNGTEDHEPGDDSEDLAASQDRRPQRYNAAARRKVEEYFEKKNLERLTRDFNFDND